MTLPIGRSTEQVRESLKIERELLNLAHVYLRDPNHFNTTAAIMLATEMRIRREHGQSVEEAYAASAWTRAER